MIFLDHSSQNIKLAPNIIILEKKEREKVSRKKPKLLLWSVAKKGESLHCAVLDIKEGSCRKAIVLAAGNPRELEVLQTVVTSEYGLALLLKDNKAMHYYASTMRKTVEPYEKITRRKISITAEKTSEVDVIGITFNAGCGKDAGERCRKRSVTES